MAKLDIKVRKNADGTATIRVGRYVEHLDAHLSPMEAFDAVKWALVTAGVPLSDDTTEEIWRIARGLSS